jgi:hypothetical protein
LFFAVITIAYERRRHGIAFAQNGLAFDTSHGHVRPQVQRIVHHINARPNLNRATPERRHVIHRGLQGAIIRADKRRAALANREAWPLLHRGVHSFRKLPFVSRWREVFRGGASEPCEAGRQENDSEYMHQ